MADTLRTTLNLVWEGNDGRREASFDDLRAVVTRDLVRDSFVYAGIVFNGNKIMARSLRYSPNVGSMNAAMEFCEMAMGAEFWRRACP